MTVAESPTRTSGPQPILDGTRGIAQQIGVYVFVVVPCSRSSPPCRSRGGGASAGPTSRIAAVFYVVSGLGVTVGFHRYFTHGSFKATRPLRIALAIAGSLAMQGRSSSWVADHRRHHAFSDKEGDPHSPWLFGTGAGRAGPRASGTRTWAGCSTATRPTRSRFTPDLLADRDIAARQPAVRRC